MLPQFRATHGVDRGIQGHTLALCQGRRSAERGGDTSASPKQLTLYPNGSREGSCGVLTDGRCRVDGRLLS
jgi:hypothetical protein